MSSSSMVDEDGYFNLSYQMTLTTTSMEIEVPVGSAAYHYPQDTATQLDEEYNHLLMLESMGDQLQYAFPPTPLSDEVLSSSPDLTTSQGSNDDFSALFEWLLTGKEAEEEMDTSMSSIFLPFQSTNPSLSASGHDPPTTQPSIPYSHYNSHRRGIAGSSTTVPGRTPVSSAEIPTKVSEAQIEPMQYEMYQPWSPNPKLAAESIPSVQFRGWREYTRKWMRTWRGSPDLANTYDRLVNYPVWNPGSTIPSELLDPFLEVKRYAIEVGVEFMPPLIPCQQQQQQQPISYQAHQGQNRLKGYHGYRQSFSEKDGRKRKRRGKGSRDGAEAFICLFPECGKTIKRRDQARDHVASHVESRPYPCHDSCPQRFLRLADLRRHQKTCQAGTVSFLQLDARSSESSSMEDPEFSN